MKKQILAVASLLTVAGLAGCGQQSKIKVGLLCLHGETSTYDKNFIDGFKAAGKAQGVDAIIREGIDEDASCTEAGNDMADEGYKFVFANSFGHESFLLAAAEKNPEVQYGHATGTTAHTKKVKNFHNAFASIYEGRYLAGVAAGMKLQSMNLPAEQHKIGYVGAWPYAEVISGYTSFYLGVKSIVSDVTMDVKYTSSWYDENLEKNTAKALIDGGCKLISQHADSWGAPTACEDAGVPNVSYNGTTDSKCPNTFVISSLINWQPYFEKCFSLVKQGKTITEDFGYDYYGQLDNGVELTTLGAKATEGLNIQAKLDEVKKDLKDGKTKVFDTSTFTVKTAAAANKKINIDAEGHLTSYLADVDDAGDFVGETEAVVTKGGKTYFAESEFRSAPYFDIIIDGINIL